MRALLAVLFLASPAMGLRLSSPPSGPGGISQTDADARYLNDDGDAGTGNYSYSAGSHSFVLAGSTFTISCNGSACVLFDASGRVTGSWIVGSTLTVQGNAFSVGGSTFVVVGSSIGIRTASPAAALDVAGASQFGFNGANSTFTAAGQLKVIGGSAAFDIGGSSLAVSTGIVIIGQNSCGTADPRVTNFCSYNLLGNRNIEQRTDGLAFNCASGSQNTAFDICSMGNAAYEGMVLYGNNSRSQVIFQTTPNTDNFGFGDTSPDYQVEILAKGGASGALAESSPTTYVLAVSSQNDTTLIIGLRGDGVIVSSGPAPTIACNAGTGVVQINSNNNHGEFVAGAAAANCTLTFANAWPSKPRCWCNNETTTDLARAVPTTTTIQCVSADGNFGGETIQYGCMGAP